MIRIKSQKTPFNLWCKEGDAVVLVLGEETVRVNTRRTPGKKTLLTIAQSSGIKTLVDTEGVYVAETQKGEYIELKGKYRGKRDDGSIPSNDRGIEINAPSQTASYKFTSREFAEAKKR